MTVKNLIKSTLFMALVVTSSIFFGQNQQMQKRTPEQKAQRQTMWMQKNLGISDDQSSKVYNVLLNATHDEEEVKADATGADRRAAIQDIKNNMDARLQAILSPEQFQAYARHRDEMKAKMKERKAGAINSGY